MGTDIGHETRKETVNTADLSPRPQSQSLQLHPLPPSYPRRCRYLRYIMPDDGSKYHLADFHLASRYGRSGSSSGREAVGERSGRVWDHPDGKISPTHLTTFSNSLIHPLCRRSCPIIDGNRSPVDFHKRLGPTKRDCRISKERITTVLYAALRGP